MSKIRQVGAQAFGVLACLVFLLGILTSKDPLIPVACGFALTVLIGTVAVSQQFTADALMKPARVVGGAMLFTFFGLFAITMALGGGALNGRVTESGDHYLRNHGVETLVSGSAYYLVAGVETFFFTLWPAGFVVLLKASNYGERKL